MNRNPSLYRQLIVAAALASAVPLNPIAAGQSCPPVELDRLPGPYAFGSDVAVNGALAIVRASGANASIIERDAKGQWSMVAPLAVPSSTLDGSVSISGASAIVGALIGGVPVSGRSFIFGQDAGGPNAWGLVTERASSVFPANPTYIAVAIDGDIAVVGSGQEQFSAGIAVVYERNLGGPEAWGQRAVLAPPPGSSLVSRFGISVAVRGERIAVGADHAFSSTEPGEVFVYERDAGGPDQWGQVAVLSAADCPVSAFFGCAVAIGSDVILVGASYQNDGDILAAGAAYLFERDLGGPGAWGQLVKLTAPDSSAFDSFGSAVDIHGRELVVGAWSDEPGGTAYVFERNYPWPNAWGHYLKVTGSGAGANAQFGLGVAIDGGTVLVGSPFDDADDGGAVYAFSAGGPDCNLNSIPDGCDILDGGSLDADGDGVPDECQCTADLDGSGSVGINDLLALLAAWGSGPVTGPPDLDYDGEVGINDFLLILSLWGPCQGK